MVITIARIIHILSGVAWAGGAFMSTAFVVPTSEKLGPEGGKFMQHLTGPAKFSIYMSVGSLLTTVAGLYLYWENSGGFNPDWMFSGRGLALTIGGLAGLIAFVYGTAVTGKLSSQLGAVGKTIQAQGAPPSSEQMAQIQALRVKLAQSGRISSLLLLIAVIGMAAA